MHTFDARNIVDGILEDCEVRLIESRAETKAERAHALEKESNTESVYLFHSRQRQFLEFTPLPSFIEHILIPVLKSGPLKP